MQRHDALKEIRIECGLKLHGTEAENGYFNKLETMQILLKLKEVKDAK